MRRNTLPVYVLLFVTANCFADVYKCTDETGKINDQDKPCTIGMAEKVDGLANSSSAYSAALARALKAQMQERSIPDSAEAKTLLEPIVIAGSLKTYTKNLILKEIVRLCSSALPADGSNIKSAFNEYSKVKSDELVVGKYTFLHGLVNKEQGWHFTPDQLADRVQKGNEETRKRYTVSSSNSKEAVLAECGKQERFLESAVTYGL
jgi:hypothetical protein